MDGMIQIKLGWVRILTFIGGIPDGEKHTFTGDGG